MSVINKMLRDLDRQQQQQRSHGPLILQRKSRWSWLPWFIIPLALVAGWLGQAWFTRQSEGCFSQELSRYIMDLDEEQQQAAERFLQIAPPALVNAWTSQGNSQVSQDLAHLRRMLRQFNGADCMVPAIADVWYQLTTERIDRMQQIMLLILAGIDAELQQALADAERNLTEVQAQSAGLNEPGSPVSSLLFDPSMPGLHGIAMATPEPERWNPFYKLQQEQATSFAQSAVVQRS